MATQLSQVYLRFKKIKNIVESLKLAFNLRLCFTTADKIYSSFDNGNQALDIERNDDIVINNAISFSPTVTTRSVLASTLH